MYGGPDQLQFDDYDGYVEGFIRAVDPLMISFDHYPFRKNDDRPDLFANLEVARRDSQKQGVPMWVIIQALQDATQYRTPSLKTVVRRTGAMLASHYSAGRITTTILPPPGGESSAGTLANPR